MACVGSFHRMISMPNLAVRRMLQQHSAAPNFITNYVKSSSYFTSNSKYHITSTAVRWKYPCLQYSTKSPSDSSSSSSTPTAEKIAQDLLANTLKQESKQNEGSKANTDADTDEKQQEEERERTKRALKFSLVTFGVIMAGTGGGILYRWGSPPCDEEGNELRDQFSKLPIVEQYLRRSYHELTIMRRMIQEPSRDKLLPEPLSGQYIQPPYTLVLELRDVLVHPEWTYQNGWRFKKRPGIDFLLQHCAPPLFEIVIYTNEQAFTAFNVIDKLDPNGFIWYRLYKDSTNYIDGKHVKELNCLNRDLKKVIMVDWDGDAVSCQRNQLRVNRWDGSMEDKGLIQLAMLLRTIAESDVEDVRDVLDYYRQSQDPLAAFTEYQQKAMQQELERQQLIEANKQSKASWTPSFLKKRLD